MRRIAGPWAAPVFVALWALLAAPSVLPAATPPKAAKDGWEIAVAPDRADGLYAAGQTVRFTIRLTRDGKPAANANVSYEITLGGTLKHEAGLEATNQDGLLAVETSLEAPGCLAVVATYKLPGGGAAITVETGAAVEAARLRPGRPAPDDFDAFWSAQKARLAAAPMKPKLTPVAVPNVPWVADVESFEVEIACPGGAPASGYFARPKGAAAKSCPAWISFHGAGARSASLIGAAGRAKHRGMLGMDINAHGIPNGRPKEYYAALLTGDLRGYPFKGIASRDTCYFLGMYLRLKRALDFLCAQPEWDGRTLIATGSSQGGAQALVAAGLDKRVSIVSASLPALCDLGASAAGRAAGWPIGRRKLEPRGSFSALRYFDVCHFAARTRARAIVRAGLVDHTCWPTGVLAAYSALKGPKQLLVTPNSGHGWTPPEAYREASDKLAEVLAEATRPPAGRPDGSRREGR